MSEPIKVGDLVVVVGGCNHNARGLIFRVSRIYELRAIAPCCFCNGRHDGTYVDSEQPFGGKRNFTRSPLWWLKRIPPFSELEGEKHKEELTA